MGTVWRAEDELLGRQVAVKELLLDEDLPDEQRLARGERALREARTVARIKHAHVVVVHDVVEQDGRPWIVMELVDGRSLAEILAKDGPVEPREAARIGAAVTSAVRAAHAHDVLHRDIKPANVLIENGTGRVVLTDFGIARMLGTTTLTEKGEFVGSPEYCAPERMSGQEPGPQSDLWSVGVLLCAAVRGQSPFRRESLGGVLHAVVFDEIRPPEQLGPLLPVVTALLERDPERRLGAAEAEERLRGCAEPRDALFAHAAPTRSTDVRTPPPAPAKPWRRRARLVLASLAVVAAGGLAAGLLAHNQGGQAEQAATSPSTAASKPASRATAGAIAKTPSPCPTPPPPPPPRGAPTAATAATDRITAQAPAKAAL
jgi:serine/threonine protein kinase